ncbi:ATP-binding cassette domain-containing protein [Demequina aurantiaca]|uniref:ATP-binding cassette domain-containing protein n=1 Tax=Demequina aurantiaca TaxID=676200 RepID=UPI0007824967|nr:ATP-binding cassette domain-containing protein [Demequina aurantiaca]
MTDPLLAVEDLRVAYPGRGFRSPDTEILHGVSLDITAGETVGLVGESGSGKTTLGRALLGLAPVTGGRILFKGEDITHADKAARRRLTRDIQVVFQDPYTSMNPNLTIEQTLTEPLRANGTSKRDALDKVATMLDAVHLPTDSLGRYPNEFSGGQRQRIAIARALTLDPSLIVCDEPVSALDLSNQRRVLDLFIEIQERTGVAYLFVSHDLAVIRHLSHRVAVLFQGDIVEWGDCDQVTARPEHPYTQRLLMAAPLPHPVKQTKHRADRQRVLAAQREAELQSGA